MDILVLYDLWRTQEVTWSRTQNSTSALKLIRRYRYFMILYTFHMQNKNSHSSTVQQRILELYELWRAQEVNL